MKTLKRHRWSVGMTACAVVLVGAFWLRSFIDTTVQAQSPLPAPLSQVDHDAIVNLLAEISLDRDALVALNPTATQCESALSTVRTWWDTNAGSIAGLQGTIDTKVQAVRDLKASIAMGPFDAANDSALTLARQELATARAARDAAIAPLQVSLAALMSESQTATWDAIDAGYGSRMPLRMLALTDAQRISVSHALRTYHRQVGAARTKTEYDTAVAALNTAMSGILTGGQDTIINAYNSNYATASDNVATAMAGELVVADG